MLNDEPPSEVELKLEVPADAVERLRAHPLIAALTAAEAPGVDLLGPPSSA